MGQNPSWEANSRSASQDIVTWMPKAFLDYGSIYRNFRYQLRERSVHFWNFPKVSGWWHEVQRLRRTRKFYSFRNDVEHVYSCPVCHQHFWYYILKSHGVETILETEILRTLKPTIDIQKPKMKLLKYLTKHTDLSRIRRFKKVLRSFGLT